MRVEMRRCFHPGPRYGDSLAITFLSMDGVDGFLFGARAIGRALVGHAGNWDFGWFVSRAREQLGEDEVDRILKSEALTDPDLARFVAFAERRKSSSIDPPTAFEEMAKLAATHRTMPRWWGRIASPAELEKAAHALAAASEPAEQTWILRIFSARPYPLYPGLLLVLAWRNSWLPPTPPRYTVAMTFTIDDALLPAILTAGPMTDQEFADLCAEHPELNFEMSAEGELIVMAPTHSDIGASNSEVAAQLSHWARKDRRGICCDSSTGFVLPNGARRSPDASWTLKTRVAELGSAKHGSFWRLCPDFVIEVRSESDRLKPLQSRLKPLQRKMSEYLEQGAHLGWLIDPESQAVEIYRPGGGIERRIGIATLEGEGPVGGFVLDLTYVWDPLAD